MPNYVMNNPLKTRKDVTEAALQLIRPVVPYLTEGKARLELSATTAHYDEGVAGMEGFSRILWALVPMMAGKCPEAEPLWQLWRTGIENGTDPDSEEYWGDIGDFDQRMVETAVIGMGLCLLPDCFYHGLNEKCRRNLANWLRGINRHTMPKNNWKFFRVLVNIGLMNVGEAADEKLLEQDLQELESHYTRDGWYFDKPTQRDYYTLWAFHYYGLVYAAVMEKKDPERSQRFRERARLIAPRFACWFDGEGRGLPYGRSLTYRFAQSSFWAACALTHTYTEELTPGRVKGLLLRNLRFWFRQPIFDRDGVLTVGYGYPNLVISEGYNAPGSPYWSLKCFAVLALPEDDVFWTCEEEPYMPPERFCDPECLQLICRDPENRMVTSYTSGNHAYEHMHEDEKYEKLAYSTQFGFSVVKEAGTLNKGAFDSMLAVKRAGHDLWHARSGYESYSLSEEQVTCLWRPVEGVTVETVIRPVDGNWHIRRHIIRAEYALEMAEAAFAVPKDRPGKRPCDRVRSSLLEAEDRAAAWGPFGSTAVFAVKGYDRGIIVNPEANTNMMAPRTVLPTLFTGMDAGSKELICVVYASADGTLPGQIPDYVMREVEKIEK